MHRAKVFTRVTKKGTVMKVVKEHYLRDDVVCGSLACETCQAGGRAVLSATPAVYAGEPAKPHYLVPDTNIFINQMDVMEHAAITDVVVLETVLEEVKHLSMAAYTRLRALINNPARRFFVLLNEHHHETYTEKAAGESPNDRNDRAIRVATAWLTEHLAGVGIIAVMVTQDEGNRAKALAEKTHVTSLRAYVNRLAEAHPELADILADPSTEGDLLPSRASFPAHLGAAELEAGLKAGTYLQGTFRSGAYSTREATVYVSDRAMEVLIVGAQHMNRAMQDDVVAVELLPESEWRRPGASDASEADDDEAAPTEAEVPTGLAPALDDPIESRVGVKPTGKVVGIIRRGWRPYCGSVDTNREASTAGGSAHWVLFYPLDRRIPRIRIRTRQLDALVGQRIVVVVDGWEATSKYPHGHFVRAIGPVGDRATEVEVILLEHDIAHHPFSPAVLACLPSPDWTADTDPHASSADRVDLRHLEVCSVDPPGCTDIDDALHVVPLGSGRYEVGVHIADVTHFVRPGSAMDVEAASRGTTVYLVGRRIDMLPELLGSNLCSLRENVDRFAFSVIWELDEEAVVQSVRFCKSIIRSRASLTYDAAQQRIDATDRTDSLSVSLRTLNALAKKLKQRRIDAGALFLASPEVRFNLENDSQDPVDLEMKAMQEANSMVEEFMLLANVSVAKRIHEAFPACALLRRHPAPDVSRFDYLVEAAAGRGVRLDPSSSKALAQSLDAATVPGEPAFNRLLRILCTRCMTPAAYICSGAHAYEEYWHYGLACPIYTHFTSPIRRYADVMVHRLLAAAIGADQVASTMLDKDHIVSVASNLNRRHRLAQYAARASVELFTVLYFKNRHLDETAHIIRVLRQGIVVLVDKYGFEGLVMLKPASGSAALPLQFEPTRHRLAAPTLGVRLELFAPVVVRLSTTEDTARRQARTHLALVAPALPGISVPPTPEEAVAAGTTSASATTATLVRTATIAEPEVVVHEAPKAAAVPVHADAQPAPAPAPAPAQAAVAPAKKKAARRPAPESPKPADQARKKARKEAPEGAFSDEEEETTVVA